MTKEHCKILISATSKEEANKISDTLVTRRLVAGTLITKGDSCYWWEGRIVEKEYFNVNCFSLITNKEEIISEIKRIHSDNCPIIAFTEIGGNEEFLEWIKESVKH